jgi:hypothetical protein
LWIGPILCFDWAKITHRLYAALRLSSHSLLAGERSLPKVQPFSSIVFVILFQQFCSIVPAVATLVLAKIIAVITKTAFIVLNSFSGLRLFSRSQAGKGSICAPQVVKSLRTVEYGKLPLIQTGFANVLGLKRKH